MNPVKSLTDYFRSSAAELKKITWPSRQETVRYTLLVSAVSLCVAVLFASLDFGLGKVVDATLLNRAPAGIETPAADIVPELEILDDSGVKVEAEGSNEFLPIDIDTADATDTQPVTQ